MKALNILRLGTARLFLGGALVGAASGDSR